MTFGLDDLIENMHGARKYFLAHLNGLHADQWDWKPSPESRSLREILIHLAGPTGDEAAEEGSDLFSAEEPIDNTALHAALRESLPDLRRVQALFEEVGRKQWEGVRQKYAHTPLDTEIAMPGGDWFTGNAKIKLGTLLARGGIEHFYHTGQISFIRIATDPDWNYGASVYGEE